MQSLDQRPLGQFLQLRCQRPVRESPPAKKGNANTGDPVAPVVRIFAEASEFPEPQLIIMDGIVRVVAPLRLHHVSKQKNPKDQDGQAVPIGQFRQAWIYPSSLLGR